MEEGREVWKVGIFRRYGKREVWKVGILQEVWEEKTYASFGKRSMDEV